jgi:uncharacterized protein YjbI with pentapeptide repeats
MSSNTEFDELFALRILFQDEFDNESDIICELNYELIKRGMSIENIPNILKQFYESFGINMTIEQINQIIQQTHTTQQVYTTHQTQAYTTQQTQTQQTHEQYLANQFINILNHYINRQITSEQNNNLINNNLENNNLENNNLENNNLENNNLENNNLENNNLENNNLENYDDVNNNLENYDDVNNDNDDEETNEEINEDTSGNIINFSNNNQIIRNIQLSFTPINSRTTIEYTFNQDSISQPSLNNLNTLLRNINSNPLIILPSFSTNQTISQSLFNPILSGIFLTEPIMDDVVSTLDDSENDKLKVYKLIEKKEEKCSICMSEINIDEQVCDLPCNHTFHNECIQPWLKHYNYKCPVCRKEVGKPKYNI